MNGKVGMIVFVLIVAFLYVHQRSSPPRDALREEPGSQVISSSPYIVILPFQSLGETEIEDALALGLTEDLITDLSNVEDLRVAPFLAVYTFRDGQIDMKEIEKRLRARFVLRGSVRRTADTVRISAQLVDVSTMENIWGERFDREVQLKDLFSIQDDITRKIIEALEMSLSPDDEKQLGKQPTLLMEAYDYYVLGREYYWRRTKETNARAVEMFLKAIETDPRYALAYAGLSNCYALRYDHGWDPDVRWLEEAIALAEKAARLDPELPDAYHAKALALLDSMDFSGAIEYDEKAIGLRPNYYVAFHTLGIALFNLGRYDEARRALQKCLTLYPSHDAAIRDIGRSHALQEAYRSAVPFFKQAYTLNPNCRNMIYLGRTLTRAGKKEEGEALLKEAIERYPREVWPYEFLARFHMRQLHLEEAQQLYEQVLRMAPNMPSAIKNAATFHHMKGDLGRTRALIERSLSIEPRNKGALIRLCSYHYTSGDIEQALTLSAELLDRFPGELPAHLLRIQLLLLLGRFEEAQELTEGMVSAFGYTPAAVALRIRTLLLNGRTAEAEGAARMMTSRFPESPRGANLLAAALFKQGRIDEAVEAQLRAMDIDPDDPEILYNTVKVLEAAGRDRESRERKERLAGLPIADVISYAPLGEWEFTLFWLRDEVRLYPE